MLSLIAFIIGAFVGVFVGLFTAAVSYRNKETEYYNEGFADGVEMRKDIEKYK